jgi:large subunit ribosomal protein L23
MKEPWTVIRHPVLSEKSNNLQRKANTYVFSVDVAANKPDIKRAIETAYKVKVEDVRTIRVKGKAKGKARRAWNLTLGRRKDWKKAYVTLAEGSRLDLI